MRLGIPEIVIILIIIIAIFLIGRISRANHGTTKQRDSSAEISYWQAAERESRPRSYLKRLGIALTLVGVILALAGISMFKWALQSYIWAFALLTIGLFIVFVSRRK
jgi:membrane protein required for beta-lactamase induction